MSAPRAPSVDLIRALRRSAFATAQSTRCRTSLPRPAVIPRAFTTLHSRLAAQTQGHTGGQSPEIAKSRMNPNVPASRDRGPKSSEDTQTDFGLMDIYGNTPEPATSIDACTPGGFHLNNGGKITGGTGVLLVGGEAYAWRPWTSQSSLSSTNPPRISDLLDKLGRLEMSATSLALLKYLHPKPDLLIVGTGSRTLMLAPETRRYIMEDLGLRVDVMDTANASAAYNLLAKERGVDGGAGVGAAMLPIGWKGVKST